MIENYQAEAAVLGSVLVDPTVIKDLKLEPDHFQDSKNKKIYQAMLRAEKDDETIDMVVVTTRLGNAIETVGGTTYLLQLTNSVASTASVKHYEQLVLDAYRMRKSKLEAMAYADNPSDEG